MFPVRKKTKDKIRGGQDSKVIRRNFVHSHEGMELKKKNATFKIRVLRLLFFLRHPCTGIRWTADDRQSKGNKFQTTGISREVAKRKKN